MNRFKQNRAFQKRRARQLKIEFIDILKALNYSPRNMINTLNDIEISDVKMQIENTNDGLLQEILDNIESMQERMKAFSKNHPYYIFIGILHKKTDEIRNIVKSVLNKRRRTSKRTPSTESILIKRLEEKYLNDLNNPLFNTKRRGLFQRLSARRAPEIRKTFLKELAKNLLKNIDNYNIVDIALAFNLKGSYPTDNLKKTEFLLDVIIKNLGDNNPRQNNFSSVTNLHPQASTNITNLLTEHICKTILQQIQNQDSKTKLTYNEAFSLLNKLPKIVKETFEDKIVYNILSKKDLTNTRDKQQALNQAQNISPNIKRKITKEIRAHKKRQGSKL